MGPSAGVVISGNNAVGVFQVDGGVTATLAGLTISGGSATSGGGIANGGTLTFSGCTIAGNTGTYQGGGIYNAARAMTVTDCNIENNSSSYSDSYLGGGGIENVGTMTVNGSTISGNSTAPTATAPGSTTMAH